MKPNDRGHVPIRTCVVCGDRKPKNELLRAALKSEERSIVLDRDQNLGGRGAYVCPDCLPRMRFTKRFRRPSVIRPNDWIPKFCSNSQHVEQTGWID